MLFDSAVCSYFMHNRVASFSVETAYLNKKVKESRNRPGVAQSAPGSLSSQISWHSAREDDEVVSLTHRPPLHPGNIPGTHFH